MAMKPGVMRTKLRQLVRPFGNPKVRVDQPSGNVVGVVRCYHCSYTPICWSTNLIYIVDRWAEHLARRHPQEKFEWTVTTEPLPEHAMSHAQRRAQDRQLAMQSMSMPTQSDQTEKTVPDELIRELVRAGRLDPSWLEKIKD